MLEHKLTQWKRYAKRAATAISLGALFIATSGNTQCQGEEEFCDLVGRYDPTGGKMLPANEKDYLNILQQQIMGSFRKNEEPYNASGRVKVETIKDKEGFEQPALLLTDEHSETEELYFTNMLVVKGIVAKCRWMREPEHFVAIRYKSSSQENGFNSVDLYQIKVGEDYEIATEIISRLSKRATYGKVMGKLVHSQQKELITYVPNVSKENVPETPKQLPLRLYLTRTEQQEICKTETLSGKEAKLLTTLTFENCIYSPGESTSGLEELSQQIKGLNSSKEGALLACGHATALPADGCQPEIDEYNNFQLSFDRANTTAVFIESNFAEQMGYLTLNVYPNSTNLDERTVRVYYITNQENDSK